MTNPPPMTHTLARNGAFLAINLLFLMVWGFSGIDKVRTGPPEWFAGKFGATLLGKFPGVALSFWLLTAAELLGFGLAVGALVRREFLGRKSPVILAWTLSWSLFVFVQLGFGNWLTGDYNATAMLFNYFAGTLLALHFVMSFGRRPDLH